MFVSEFVSHPDSMFNCRTSLWIFYLRCVLWYRRMLEDFALVVPGCSDLTRWVSSFKGHALSSEWHHNLLPPSEFDALLRLGIPDPSSYIKKRFRSNKLLFLRAACVGQALVDQVEASVEEAVNSATWTDLQVIPVTVSHVLYLQTKQAFRCSWFSPFLLLAGSAQLPLHGGCWDPHQPGYEEHKYPVLCQSAGRDCRCQWEVHQQLSLLVWWDHAAESSKGKSSFFFSQI